MRLHPFEDGNGRVARLLAAYVLLCSGYRSTLFTAVDQHAAHAPEAYCASLREVTAGALSPADWIHYAVDAMARGSDLVAWFRARRCRVMERCAALGLDEHESEAALIRFDLDGRAFPPPEAGFAGERPWKEIVARLPWPERRALGLQLRRLREEEAAQGRPDGPY